MSKPVTQTALSSLSTDLTITKVQTSKTKAYSTYKTHRQKNKIRRFSSLRKIKNLAMTTWTSNTMFILPTRKTILGPSKAGKLQDLLALEANTKSRILVKTNTNPKGISIHWNLTRKSYPGNKLNLSKSSISRD